MTSYATRIQLEERFGQVMVAQAAIRDGLDADQVIAAAILGAGQIIDGYVGTRYDTPLSPAPELVTEIALDMAWYKLWRNEVPQNVVDRYKDCVRMLRDIQDGRMTLPGVAGRAAAPADNTDNQVLLDCPERPLSGKLGGW